MLNQKGLLKMRLHLNYKEIEKREEPFTAVVDRGNGLEIWNYKTGTDAETHGEQIKSGRARTEKKIQKEENEFTIKLDANTSQVLKTIAKVTELTVEEIIVRIIKKETRPNE